MDWSILHELQESARLSYSELGRRVKLSAPAVTERVQRMEAAGIVRAYRAVVDPDKIGLPVKAIVRFRVVGGAYPRALERIGKMPEVRECHRTTGSDCFVLKVAVPSVQHLEGLIDSLITYGEASTSIILSSPVEERIFVGPGHARKSLRT